MSASSLQPGGSVVSSLSTTAATVNCLGFFASETIVPEVLSTVASSAASFCCFLLSLATTAAAAGDSVVQLLSLLLLLLVVVVVGVASGRFHCRSFVTLENMYSVFIQHKNRS